ncbi:hypothetical protein GX411_03085 [Candidatus Fermentibacteria bacterium]|nr:hypothetical protein [Candidatus Fermentibacteria bacterium]
MTAVGRDPDRLLRRSPAALTAAVVPLVLLTALWSLSLGKSLTGDEAMTVALVRLPFGSMLSNVAEDAHVPGYYALLWVWVRVFGVSQASLRAPGLVAAALTALAAARGRGTAARYLLCVSPFVLHLSVEIRMYSMLALAGAWTMLLLGEYSSSPSLRRAAVTGLVLAAGTWIHHFAWPGVAASALLMLIRRKPLHALVMLAIVSILYIPQIPNLALEKGGAAATAGATGGEALIERASPVSALAHMPLSLAGTLLRFTSGTAPYRFTESGLASLSPWAVAGMILSVVMCFAALRGWRISGTHVRLLILFVMLPLAFLRPSARHFAFAFPAVAACVIAGLYSLPSRPGRSLRIAAALLSAALCIPFITRSTLPQRCTFDRDFREAARVAGAEAERTGARIVIYIDHYSTLAFRYHLEEQGFGGVETWSPHDERFLEGRYFQPDPSEGLSFLMQDTDSTVRAWRDSFGTPLLILANDPAHAGIRVSGGPDGVIGTGSDVISDADLRTSLEQSFSVHTIPLTGSSGPLTLFAVGSSRVRDSR